MEPTMPEILHPMVMNAGPSVIPPGLRELHHQLTPLTKQFLNDPDRYGMTFLRSVQVYSEFLTHWLANYYSVLLQGNEHLTDLSSFLRALYTFHEYRDSHMTYLLPALRCLAQVDQHVMVQRNLHIWCALGIGLLQQEDPPDLLLRTIASTRDLSMAAIVAGRLDRLDPAWLELEYDPSSYRPWAPPTASMRLALLDRIYQRWGHALPDVEHRDSVVQQLLRTFSDLNPHHLKKAMAQYNPNPRPSRQQIVPFLDEIRNPTIHRPDELRYPIGSTFDPLQLQSLRDPFSRQVTCPDLEPILMDLERDLQQIWLTIQDSDYRMVQATASRIRVPGWIIHAAIMHHHTALLRISWLAWAAPTSLRWMADYLLSKIAECDPAQQRLIACDLSVLLNESSTDLRNASLRAVEGARILRSHLFLTEETTR